MVGAHETRRQLFIRNSDNVKGVDNVRESWKRLYPTASSLGFSPSQMLLIVLPETLPTLLAGAMMAWSRAMGDTMIALMLSGNSSQSLGHLQSPLRTLTAHIALTSSSDTTSIDYCAIFLSGVFLLLFCCALHHLAQRLSKRGRAAQ